MSHDLAQPFSRSFLGLLAGTLLCALCVLALEAQARWHPWLFATIHMRVAKLKPVALTAAKFSHSRDPARLTAAQMSHSQVNENGTPLSRRAASIAEIEKPGALSVFRVKDTMVWFTASDATSPLTNGRLYELRVPYAVHGAWRITCAVAFMACMFLLVCHADFRSLPGRLKAFACRLAGLAETVLRKVAMPEH